ncbi:MAG: response regulator [Bacilli bacterium]|nr:response regulator [Mycoplasmatota bacterium]MEE0014741.1 response regulator [Bacilli bacterium]
MYDVNFLISNGVDVNKSLELFGDIDTYNETVGEFLVSAKEKIAKLQKYKDDKDMPNYAIYVHSLKSDAKYFGFTKLADLAYDQELKSKEGDMFYIYEHYQELIDEVERTINIVKKYISPESEVTSNEQVPTSTTPAPAAVPAPVTPAPAVPLPTSSNIEPAEVYSQKTILVVDDSNIIRNFVKRIFSEKYNIGMAKDGEEALNIIKANASNENIVAILLDLNMPKVDGFAVLTYMNEHQLFDSMPVSIISGDSTKDTINKAFTYPIIDMLGKPFTEADVKRVIEKTMYFKENM